MEKLRFFLTSFFILFAYCILSAQTVPNFTNLTGSGTVCNYGNTSNPLAYTGIVFNRHTVITQTGTDPNTGFQLPFLPAGEDTVIRLGNSQVGSEAEAVTYQFTVNPQYSMLELKFAVVFEDPNHIQVAQPRFVVKVINALGQLVEQCSEYDVSAGSGVAGFNTFFALETPIRWRPWTNIGIDLSQYVGQEIRVQFITYDCSQSGHYGYAYYTAHCIDNQLSLTACDGDSVTLSAPAGFSTYLWSNGANTPSTTYQVSNGSLTANCVITSVTGCQFTLNAYISSSSDLPNQDTVYFETICQGDTFAQHFFNLPAQNSPGTFVYLNSFYNLNNCEGSVTAILHLTVLQTYYNINESVCAGEDYTDFGFQLTNLQPGIYYDTLFYTGSSGCDSNLCLQLIVNPSFQLPNMILGNTTPCQGEIETYSLQGATGLNNYLWIVPNEYTIISGQGTPSITMSIGNTAVQGDLVLHGSNGCGSGSVSLTLTPNPSFHIFYLDSICTGNNYSQYGFYIPIQDSLGYFTFTQHLSTVEGCDSIITLALLVTKSPTISILSYPEVICVEDFVQLHAIGNGANIVISSPLVAIGDILCTDNTFAKPSNWPVPGKVAYGVVFYVDSTGQHGWATHLHDHSSIVPWSVVWIDFLLLPNVFTYQDAMMEIDGFTNTLIIRSNSIQSTSPAAFATDFANGWYLPALWQLKKLLGSTQWINSTMQIIGGTQFPSHLNGETDVLTAYWSSSEVNEHTAWFVHVGGNAISNGKSQSFRVRSVRNF